MDRSRREGETQRANNQEVKTFTGTLHEAVLWLIVHCRTFVGWRTRVELRMRLVDESRIA